MREKAGQNIVMLVWFRSMPKVRQITMTFALAMLFASLVGLVVDEQSKGVFSLIYFFAPVVWSLWIWSALQARKERSGFMLALLWVVIDLSILINLISLTTPKVGASLGMDGTILIAYLPVLMPIGFLHSVIPAGFSFESIFDTQSGLGALMPMWCEATSWAAMQSIFIYWAGRLSWGLKRQRHQ